MFRSNAFLFVSLLSPFKLFEINCVFYLTLMGIFDKLLGLNSLECPMTFLVHW
jgi:hypothetical protein